MLSDEDLERSSTVANNLMNRERVCTGKNSYAKDLRFDPLEFLRARLQNEDQVKWLDLCCGRGRALIEAAHALANEPPDRLMLLGIDLVPTFDSFPIMLPSLKLIEASISNWSPDHAFDLITCVHGLHYIGDKLGVISKAVSWLKPDGQFIANLDLNNLKSVEGKPLTRTLLNRFRTAGLTFDNRNRIIACKGSRRIELGYRYLGADDKAGPNYTGQPAVDSFYV